MKAVFIDGFDDKKDIEREFHVKLAASVKIVFAVYEQENWSGRALVVFIQDGKLYEVNDSHCSCRGLENWEPEETSIGALRMRTFNSWGVGDTLRQALNKQLDKLERQAAKNAA